MVNTLAGICRLQANPGLGDQTMPQTAKIEITLDTFKAIEAARLSLSETHDEIVRRALSSHRPMRPSRETTADGPKAVRKRGNICVDLFGRIVPVANLKDAYLTILNALVRHKPSLFELLSHEGTNRRRWAARDGAALYPATPHLAQDHAFAVAGDWFVDTNLSGRQIAERLRVAARLAGYRYGEDVSIVEGPVADLP
jgi:hypothetical protein